MAKKTKKVKKTKKSNGSKLFSGTKPISGFSNLPAGTYEGYIKPGSAVLEPKPDGGGYRAKLVLVATSPDEYENREQRYSQDLTSEFGKGLFLGMLETLGFNAEIDTIEDAAEIMAQTDNIPVRFWVGEPRDEFPPRVSINDRLDDEDGEDTENEDEDADGTEEEEEYTKKDIKKMSDEELDELAEELDLDPDEYDTYKELREAIYEELDL